MFHSNRHSKCDDLSPVIIFGSDDEDDLTDFYNFDLNDKNDKDKQLSTNNNSKRVESNMSNNSLRQIASYNGRSSSCTFVERSKKCMSHIETTENITRILIKADENYENGKFCFRFFPFLFQCECVCVFCLLFCPFVKFNFLSFFYFSFFHFLLICMIIT